MLRFEMSGQRFEFDEDPAKFTYDDLFVVEDLFDMTIDDFLSRAKLIGQPGAASAGLRAMGIVAFLSYRRSGGELEWPAFSRTIAPATLRMIPDEPKPEPVVSPTAAAFDAEPNVFDIPQPPA